VSRARSFAHLARADFLDRVRRPGFLMTLGFAVFLGWTVAAGKLQLWVGDARGVYNSAWVGTLTALVVNTFLSLVGFYLVKNAVERDRRTGVGQILATTPLSKPLYTLGKAASNLAVLGAMLAVMVGAAAVAQLVAGEESRLEPWALVAPFLFLSLPVLALAAALAVAFEATPGLRGGFGNVVWFVLWASTIPAGITAGLDDPVGLRRVVDDLQAAADAALGPADRGFVLGGVSRDTVAQVFPWDGVDWTAEALAGRSVWLLAAVLVALAAAIPFDRFDPARGGRRARRRSRKKKEEEAAAPEGPALQDAHLTPLAAAARGRFRFLAVVRAELRLSLAGRPWWAWAVAGGLAVAALFRPLETVRSVLLPLSWIWPLLLWSALGNREVRHGMAELLDSAPRPLGRQFPAAWVAGVLITLAAGLGPAVRFVSEGAWDALAAGAVGALFIPTLALAAGIWSGGPRLFEVSYLFLWYAGPMQKTPALDYLGATAAGKPAAWIAATALLGVAAWVGRGWRLRGLVGR
jgi:hypothetical protein